MSEWTPAQVAARERVKQRNWELQQRRKKARAGKIRAGIRNTMESRAMWGDERKWGE